MKKNLLIVTLLLLMIKIKVGHAQNATVMNVINNFYATANIQFFAGDYFYYSDNYNLQQTNYLRRFNLDTKKDTILQTLSFGCNVTSNLYSWNCITQGALTIGNNAYVLIGNSFYRFNLTNFIWQPLQNYPSNFNNYRASILTDGGNYIYVWGSRDISGFSPVLSNQLWRYDIANDSWFLLSTAPVSDMSKSGVYKYPFLIFGSGTENWNVVRTYNLLSNTWSTMPAPPLSGNWQHESYFVDNNILYCIVKDCLNACYFSLFSFNDITQTWTQSTLNNFSTNLNSGPGVFDAGGLLESFYKRNNTIYFSNNMLINNLQGPGQCTSHDICNGQITALSMKRQINLIIDSTSCYNNIDDSLMIYYRIEYAGGFNASNTSVYLSDINNNNPLQIFSNSNFFSSNVTVQNKFKKIHKNYLTNYLRAYNYQGTDTIYSTNKFPVNYKLRLQPNDNITALNPINVCSGQPVANILQVNNLPGRTYKWFLNNSALVGQTSFSYTSIQTGTYNCSIYATTTGCSYTTTPIIIQNVANPTVQISYTGTNVICQGNSVILSSTTSPVFSYQWKLNGNNIAGATSSTYNAVQSGTITLMVTNSSSCSTTSSAVSITVNPTPTISVSNGTICSGNSFTITPSGASTYTYSGGSAVVNPLTTSVYTVNGSSNQNCNALPKTLTVTVNQTPTITVTNGTICSGNSFTITPSGASTYTYSGGSAIVNPLTTSVYTVNGSSAQNCGALSKTLTVTVNQTPTIMVSNGTICSGNSFTITPSGASTYTYSGGSAIVNPLTTSVYTVNGSSAQNCNALPKIVTVTVNQTPTISVINGTICLGDSFTITPNGASTYTYSSGSSIVNPLATTVYTVSGSSVQNCNALPKTLTVTVNQTPTITVSNGTICSGNSFTITPSGASTYTYSGGSAIVSPLATTIYTVSGSSAQNCNSTQTLALIVNQTPTLSVNSGSICPSNSFTITPSGASTYTYSSGSAVVNPMSTTVYTVSGSSAQNCNAMPKTLTVTVNQTPTLSVSNGTICSGNSFTITPSGASTYTYSSGSAIINPIATTVYTVNGSSSQNCIATPVTLTITVNQTPTISVSNGTICSGNSFTITPSGASSYTYSSGSAVVNPLSTTIYTVSGSSNQNCNALPKTLTLTVNQTPTLSVNNASICVGTPANLVATGANTYNWSNGAVTSSISVSPTTTTIYTVTGLSNNCSKTQTVSVFVSPCTGIFELQSENSNVQLYPNPVKDQLTIVIHKSLIGKNYTITNTLGQQILKGTLINEQTTFVVQNLLQGLYQLNIDGINKNYKFIKE